MKDGKFSKYFIYGLIISLSGMLCIGFYFLITDGAQSLISMKNGLIKIMLPFIDGFCIAFILNPVMNFIEKKWIIPLFGKFKKFKGGSKSQTLYRTLSITITYIIFILLLYGLIMLVIPQLIDSIQSIALKIPGYINNLNCWFSNLIKNNNDWEELFNTYSANVEEYVTNSLLPNIQKTVSKWSSLVLGSVVVILVGIFKFIIGIIISVYLLAKKELYLAQCKKLIYAYFSEDRANNLLNNLRFTNKTFGGFFVGKIVDSIIIGIICFIAMTIMKMPYSLLISTIVGVTNIIPFFGPYLGAIPSALILLMINPMKCLMFIIFILVLQQFDGNILGPKILGESTGLSGIWVIFSITLFGGLFGILGMFLGVPVFAVLYAAFKTYVESRLQKKEMPKDTLFYMKNDYHSSKNEDATSNVGKSFKLQPKYYKKNQSYSSNSSKTEAKDNKKNTITNNQETEDITDN